FRTALIGFIISLLGSIHLQASRVFDNLPAGDYAVSRHQLPDGAVLVTEVWRKELERELPARLPVLKQTISITNPAAILVADEDGYHSSLDSYLFGSSPNSREEIKEEDLSSGTLFSSLVSDIYDNLIRFLAAVQGETAPLIQVLAEDNKDYFLA